MKVLQAPKDFCETLIGNHKMRFLITRINKFSIPCMDFLTASQPPYRYYMPINTACVSLHTIACRSNTQVTMQAIPYCPQKQLTYKWLQHVLMMNTPSFAKVPNQKVARRPKWLSSSSSFSSFFFFFFVLLLHHHFPLSSAPGHCFFTGLKSHDSVCTTHWRTMVSFVMSFFLHVHA